MHCGPHHLKLDVVRKRKGDVARCTVFALDHQMLYVSNVSNNAVTEYPAGSNGNVPATVIFGSNTSISGPTAIAILPDGTLCVRKRYTTNAVTEYSLQEFDGKHAADSDRIAGANTGIASALSALSIAADAAGKLLRRECHHRYGLRAGREWQRHAVADDSTGSTSPKPRGCPKSFLTLNLAIFGCSRQIFAAVEGEPMGVILFSGRLFDGTCFGKRQNCHSPEDNSSVPRRIVSGLQRS